MNKDDVKNEVLKFMQERKKFSYSSLLNRFMHHEIMCKLVIEELVEKKELVWFEEHGIKFLLLQSNQTAVPKT